MTTWGDVVTMADRRITGEIDTVARDLDDK
jgi:hypothetical protein